MIKNILLLIIVLISSTVFSQTKDDKKVIQFTGAVVDADSLQPMPFVHITVKNKYIGTISDYYGFFSLIAHEHDTVEFSSVGYHRSFFVVPDSLAESSYSAIHIMQKDTILLSEFTVFSWPTREQFKYAFMHEEIPNTGDERAKINLSKEVLMVASGNVPLEGSTTYKYELENRTTRLYLAGGFPSNRLLDPIAWSKFIKAWQNGDFKKKGNINYLPK